jgi:hypothetical protein
MKNKINYHVMRSNGIYPSAFSLVLLLGAFFNCTLLVPTSGGASDANRFEGSLDKAEVAFAGGWAWDRTQPDVAIKVDVYDGTKLLASVTAAGFREDLKSAGKGDGKHAFNYAFPQTLHDGQSHTISVKYGGTTAELPGSPKTLVFPKS